MAENNPEKEQLYKAVFDTSNVQFPDNLKHPQNTEHVSKPFGILYFVKPEEVWDENLQCNVEKKTLPSQKMISAAKRADFNPDDHIKLELGFIENPQIVDYMLVRLRIPVDDCPQWADQDDINHGITVKVKLYASNLVNLNVNSVANVYVDDNCTLPEANLPYIVKKTYKFNDLKPKLLRFTFTFDNSGDTMVTEKLMNDVKFLGPSNRAVLAMRHIFSQEHLTLTFFVRDETSAPFHEGVTKLIAAHNRERTEGNVFRHFYTQRLQLSNAPHQIDCGAAVKSPSDRPQMTTKPQRAYSTVFEMTTRLGVAVLQCMEDEADKVRDLNAKPAVIRVLRTLGGGDASYYGVLAVNSEVRLNPGDKITINFNINQPIAEQSWGATILQPFKWNLQGELVAILTRPRQRHPANASAQEKKRPMPYLKSRVPVANCDAKTLEEARASLNSTVPIKCLLTFTPSDRAERRLVEAMNSASQGSRPNNVREQGAPPRIESAHLTNWVDFFQFKDARIAGQINTLNDPVALKYIKSLCPDPDQKEVINYLQYLPTTKHHQGFGIINGVPAAGKTHITAAFVVARLIANPRERICVCAATNKAADVLMTRIGDLLKEAQSDPTYRTLLQGKRAVRLYTDSAETSYVISVADRAGAQQQLQMQREIYELYNPGSRFQVGDIDSKEFQAQLDRMDKTSSNPTRHRAMSLSNDAVGLRSDVPQHLSVDFKEDFGINGTDLYDGLSREECQQLIQQLFEQKPSITSPVEAAHVPLPQSDTEDSDDDDDDIDPMAPANYFKTQSKKSKKKKRVTRQQRKAAELEEARAVHATHDVQDSRAITLSAADIEGVDNVLKFGAPLGENGTISLAHPSITNEMRTYLTAVDMAESVNRQLRPAISGVRDKRYRQEEISAATIGLELAMTSNDWSDFRLLHDRYIEEGTSMDDADYKIYKSRAKDLINAVKQQGEVIGVTVNSLGIDSNRRNLGPFDTCVVDEAGQVNLISLILILTAVDVYNLILVGDKNQLSPSAPNISGPKGCTAELKPSVLQICDDNFWPSATLNYQRRGAPGIAQIHSTLFYRGKIVDAPCTSLPGAHPLTPGIVNWFKKSFPECTSDLPIRFFDIHGHKETRDEITGSWLNLDEAAFIVNLCENGMREGIFTHSDVKNLTHYTAQQKVLRYAYARLDAEDPNVGFGKVEDHTTDSFQGEQGRVSFVSPVRTDETGFTDNKGRNSVILSRSQDALVVVGNTTYLQGKSSHSTPYMKRAFDEAKKLGVCITIKLDGPHAHLMTHRYVQAQIIATDSNAQSIRERDMSEFHDETQGNDTQAWEQLPDLSPDIQSSGSAYLLGPVKAPTSTVIRGPFIFIEGLACDQFGQVQGNHVKLADDGSVKSFVTVNHQLYAVNDDGDAVWVDTPVTGLNSRHQSPDDSEEDDQDDLVPHPPHNKYKQRKAEGYDDEKTWEAGPSSSWDTQGSGKDEHDSGW